MSNAEARRNPVEELAEDFLERYRRGERPALSEYMQRHPELAEEIRDLFPALVMMEEAGPKSGEARTARSIGSAGSVCERLGDYRILREVGRGGMGIVYEAEQESLGRHVALKVIPASFSANPLCLQRFRREARSAARLHHTNIVPVFDVGEFQGIHYYAMQFILGQGLDEVLDELRRLRDVPAARGTDAPGTHGALADPKLTACLARGLLTDQFAAGEPSATIAGVKGGPVSLAPECEANSSNTARMPGTGSELSTQSDYQYYRSVARVGLQVADALAHAHAQRVLHRDIKPANLLLDLQGTVWITDFGLAKEEGDDLTHTGDLVGTLRYMAPERFNGLSDARSDVYSLGLTLYELLTLRPAFAETDRGQLMQRIAQEEPAAPRKLDGHVPRDLETIVLKTIAKEPRQRYQTAAELAEDLGRYLADRPIWARRSAPWEHAWRWCRRNPLVAGLLGLLALVLVSAGVGGVLAAYEFRALAVQAEDAKKQAETNARTIQEGMERQNRAYQLLDRGHVHASRGWFDHALADFSEAAKLRPELAGIRTGRGDTYLNLCLYELVAQDFEQAFQLQRSPEASIWHAHACLRLYVRDWAGYARTCSEMMKHFGIKPGPRNSWWISLACSLGPDSGVDPQVTVKLAERAVADEPRSISYALTLALAQYRAGRVAVALSALQELARTGALDTHAEFQPLLALVHARLGNEKEARMWMESSRRVFASHLTALRLQPLDWRYEYLGHHDRLMLILLYREARRVVGDAPADEEVFSDILQARSHAYLGQLSAAERHFTRAIERQPKSAPLWLIRGVFWGQQGQWPRALADFDQAHALHPLGDFWDLSCRAIVQLRQGAADAYGDTCRQMMKRFGQTDEAAPASHIALVCSLAPGTIEDVTAPVWLAERSVKAYPQNPWCVLALGAALYRAGQYQQATNRLRQAMTKSSTKELQPRDVALAQLFLSMALQRLGQNSEASRALNSAIHSIDEATAGERKSNLGPRWYVWAACQALRREAESLVRDSK